MGNIVTHGCPQAVIERLSGKFERISPADGKLVALCPQVSRIFLWRGCSIYSRQCASADKHILGVTDIGLRGELEPVIEECGIKTDIVLLGSLPGKFAGVRC